MNRKKYYIRIYRLINIFSITVILSLFFLFFSKINPIYAQFCQDDSDCNTNWFCDTAYNQCCQCKSPPYQGCVYDPITDPGCTGGDRECCSNSGCDTTWITECYPNGGGVTQPPVSPSPTNTPTPPSYWLCMRPYATSQRCDYAQESKCQIFDIEGGYCFKTQDSCENGCIPPERITITPRATLNPLCTYGLGRYGINSAIGCIPVDNSNETTIFILRWAIGVTSGVVFLLIIYSAFLIMTSGGNAEKMKSGKELLTASITGLVLLIFSVYILDVFGFRIFRIPGL